MAVRNPLGLVVLAFLLQRPMHPYELGKLLKERNKQDSIRYRHASLYMVFEQLTRDGFIEPTGTQRVGALPERTVYTLTDAGRAELTEEMRRLVAEPVKEYLKFEAALALILVLPPDEVVELLGRRVEALTELIGELRQYLADRLHLDQIHLVETEYRLALAEAERTFVDNLRTRLATTDPGDLWKSLHP